MARDTACELSTKAVELREGLEAKSKEAAALSAEIQRVQLETQMARIQLLVQGVKDESTVPANLRAGGSTEESGLKYLEQKRLLEWLAEVCDLTSRKTCNVVGDLYVAGYKAVIGHGVQWPLSVSDAMNLTIPSELETCMIGLFSKAKRGLLTSDDFEQFATEWDMLSVEMSVDGDAMPGLFLVRREDSTAIVISAWPKLPPLTGTSSSSQPFDAARFFEGMSDMKPDTAKAVFFDHEGLANSLSFSRSGHCYWDRLGHGGQPLQQLGIDFHVCEPPEFERFSLTGPFGRVTIADPPPGAAQREIVEEIVSLSLEHGLHVHHACPPSMVASQAPASTTSENHSEETRFSNRFSAGPSASNAPENVENTQLVSVSRGDSVEVQYQGEWLSGVLADFQGEIALVCCDGDAPDVMTVAPLRKVRALSPASTTSPASASESPSPPASDTTYHVLSSPLAAAPVSPFALERGVASEAATSQQQQVPLSETQGPECPPGTSAGIVNPHEKQLDCLYRNEGDHGMKKPVSQ